MKIRSIAVGSYQTNCYILQDDPSKDVIVIDPGFEPERIIALLKKYDYNIKYIVITHGHGDHIGAIPVLKQNFSQSKVYISSQDNYRLKDPASSLINLMGGDVRITADHTLEDGDVIKLGNIELKVLATPGHTEGGISLFSGDSVFVGDTLFKGDVGRTDLPGGNYSMLENSIKQKLYTLPDDTIVYPGHGPSTTIRQEKLSNSYVRGN